MAYFGSATGLRTTAALVIEANQADAYFGSSAGTAGDVDGDSYADLIVGAFGYDQAPEGWPSGLRRLS